MMSPTTNSTDFFSNRTRQRSSSVLVNSGDGDDEVVDSTASLTSSATALSYQMNSLIMNQLPQPSKTHLSSVHNMNVNLSKNANIYLFPIREQKIILMYKEKEQELNFVQARIALRLEEVKFGE